MLLSSSLIWVLAQISIPGFTHNPLLFWFGSGALLCLVELLLPKPLAKHFKLVPLTMGVVAFIEAFLLWRANYIPPFNLQVIYWMFLSTACVIWVRPMVLKRKKYKVPEAAEAKTLTEILPGQRGRVVYEGSSWQACCDDRSLAIPPNQKVYVLRREGNTLIVAPDNLFNS